MCVVTLDIGGVRRYNFGMLIGAVSSKLIVGIIIAIVIVQYGLALFCLLKLAYLDLTKKEYVLWNVFILIVFFIGDIAFLIYYGKVKDTKRIPPYVPEEKTTDEPTGETESDTINEQANTATTDDEPTETQENN